ncbi:MAG: hypothetical protein IPP68_03915 [Elusimicrobia bacterium]|nr:hypothetical protein [Elusimicrobiota bacterium]
MSVFSLQGNGSKLNLTTPTQPAFKPTIKFELTRTNQQIKPLQALKTTPQPTAATLAPKQGFLNTIGNAFKAVGRAIAFPFQKIGQGIVNLVQRAFGPGKQTPTLTDSQKATLGLYRNLQPAGQGTFKTTGGQTHALNRAWEEGSTFKLEGDKLKLIQGTSMEKNFGGIERKDGGQLPLRMAEINGTIQPTGLDFDRMAPNTTLSIKSPMNIEGLGELKAGEMTYQGAWKSPDGQTTGGRFKFQNTLMDLNKDMAHGLGMNNPVAVRQATFSLKPGSCGSTARRSNPKVSGYSSRRAGLPWTSPMLKRP